jgi:hypothetical protein
MKKSELRTIIRESIRDILREDSPFPNMKEWWDEDRDKVIKFVYWLQKQIPPQDKEGAWNEIVSKLQDKNPAPAGVDVSYNKSEGGDQYSWSMSDL